MIVCVSPVAAVDVEQDDDESQAVTRQQGAAEEFWEGASTMLPSGHLTNDRDRNQWSWDDGFIFQNALLVIEM